jgi:predicted nucleotidyltransferase
MNNTTWSSYGVAGALFSKVQLTVLGLLMGHPERVFSISEIIQAAASGSGAVQRELAKLTEAGLVSISWAGKRKLYQTNHRSPVFEELRSILRKTVNLVDPLKTALAPYRSNISAAFVYGSVAKGTEDAQSDVDLMIIGDGLSYGDVSAALLGVEKFLRRPIHPNLMTIDEWRQRRNRRSGFVTRIFEQPKLFVVGTDNELK